MRKKTSPALLALGMGLFLATAPALAQKRITSVEVFGNSAMHFSIGSGKSYRVTVYQLDALQQIEYAINRQLPQNEAAATAWIAANQSRLRQIYAPLAATAANGLSLARYYRLEQVPAIVIDHKAVVYGITNVDAAVASYLSRRH